MEADLPLHLPQAPNWGFYVADILILVALGLGYHWIKSLIEEKAKAAAQKSDIVELTNKVEAVKHQFNESLEKLKASLDRKTMVHKFQFEAEFRACQALCEKAFAVTESITDARRRGHAIEHSGGLARLLGSVQAFIPLEIFATFAEFGAEMTRIIAGGTIDDDELAAISAAHHRCHIVIRKRLESISVAAD